MPNGDSKTSKVQNAPKLRESIGLRVFSNDASQQEESIQQAEMAQRNGSGAAPRVRDNAKDQVAGAITPRETFGGNHPRIATGARIRENRAYQRPQKIYRADLTVPAGDEIGYKKLFTRFEEAFTRQDILALRDCLSPAFQWHLPNGDVVYGREEALAEMERRFAMPSGPKFSASVWRFKDTTVLQTYEVEYLGPDGRWRASKGFDVYEIGGGLITRKDAYWKMIP